MQGTVFVVDDDKSIRKSLTLVLSLSGYGSRAFASAEEFLAICRPGLSGCVIADLRMPGMSGLDLQKTLTERGIEIPIIFMTAYGDVATTRAALKGGAVDFLEKARRRGHASQASRGGFDTAQRKRRGGG